MIEVVLSKTAARDILDAAIRWRALHPQRGDLFDEELRRIIALLSEHPDIGARARTRRYKNARVLVMRDSQYLLVYRRETKGRVRLLALHASKATPVRP